MCFPVPYRSDDLTRIKGDTLHLPNETSSFKSALTKLVNMFYKAFESHNLNKMRSHIDTLNRYLGDEKNREAFIVQTAAMTALNILTDASGIYDKNKLVQEFFNLMIPIGKGEQKSLKDRFFNFLGEQFLNTPDKSYWDRIENSEVRECIQSYANHDEFKKYKIAEYTVNFNLDSLRNFFDKTEDRNEYLIKIFSTIIKPKIHKIAQNEVFLKSLDTLAQAIAPDALDGGIKKYVERAKPLFVSKITEIFLKVLAPQQVEAALLNLNVHLQTLQDARTTADLNFPRDFEALQRKVENRQPLSPDDMVNAWCIWKDYLHISRTELEAKRLEYLRTNRNLFEYLLEMDPSQTPELLLETVQEKIAKGQPLNNAEIGIAREVWGEHLFIADKETLTAARKQFEKQNPIPTLFVEFSNHPHAPDAIKQPNVAVELSKYFSELAESFLSDAFLEEAMHALELKYDPRIFGFIRSVVTGYIAFQMQTNDGWYDKIVDFLSPDGMKKLLNRSILPLIKQSLFRSLLQKVMMNDFSLIDKNSDQILEACNKIYPISDLDKARFKEIADTTVATIKRKIGEIDPVLQPGTNKIRQRQFIEKLFNDAPEMGPGKTPTHQLSQLVTEEFSGISGFFRFIISFFREKIASFFGIALHPYKTQPALLLNAATSMLSSITEEDVTSLFEDRLVPPGSDGEISLESAVNDIAHLIFATTSYKASFFERIGMWLVMGNKGSRIATAMQNIFTNTLLQGSKINQAGALTLFADILKEAVRGTP